MHQRQVDTRVLFCARDLLQQFIVNAWAAIEQNCLLYLTQNQDVLRVEAQQGLLDRLPTGDDLHNIGKRIYLPASFTGGPRQMFQLYQDSIAIACYYGKIDFFLTMTANPNWQEIKDQLLLGQSSSDRPDIIARVFRQKSDALINDIYKNGILCRALIQFYAIEFQK